MARHLILIMVVLAGAGIPVQVAFKHRMEKAFGSPALGDVHLILHWGPCFVMA